MRSEAIVDYYAWFLISLFFGLEIKYKLEPLQADIGVGVSTVRVRIVPSRSGVRHPVSSVSRRGPDYHRVQVSTNGTYMFDGCDRRAFHTRTPVASLVVLAKKNFNRVELGKHDTSLIHVIHILWKNSRIVQYLPNYLEPLHDLIIDIITVPV